MRTRKKAKGSRLWVVRPRRGWGDAVPRALQPTPPIDALPTLAFDHAAILQRALEALSAQAGRIQPLFALLPPRFTLSQLQGAYEAVIGEEAEKRNFRKMVASLGCVRETDDFVHGAHRPARLYEPVSAEPAPT